jgi:hypothetical protein
MRGAGLPPIEEREAMSKKLLLDAETLEVQSFATADAAPADAGTVRANEGGECTVAATCVCATSLYHCGTLPATQYSCQYTEPGHGCESWISERQTCWDCV